MANLNNINQLRSIQWSMQHLWDIKFASSSLSLLNKDYIKDLSPFDKWLPATEVTDVMANLETTPLDAANTSFEIATETSSKTMNITFIDDVDMTLHHWFKKWINNDILNNGEGLSPVGEYLRNITLRQLDVNLQPTYVVTYSVFPKGEIVFNGTSESGNQTISVELVKVSIVKESGPSNSAFSIASKAADIITKISGGIRYSDL